MTLEMHEQVVVDTSCLIALTRINHLDLLHEVYNNLIVTPKIKEEYKFEPPKWIEVRSFKQGKDYLVINRLVDAGEASAINYFLENKNSLLVIDDSKGRKLAKKLDIKVTGTLGILVKAKEEGIINLVKPYLDTLEKIDFRFSENLKRTILILLVKYRSANPNINSFY